MRLVFTGQSGKGYAQLVQQETSKGETMFQYIKKSIWFPTSVDFRQAATIEELLKLCKQGEVERVVIPFTYYGYGSSLIDLSNSRSIERHYRKSRFKNYGYALTMSASQFVRNADYRELVEQLQEQYPVFDESDYSELETETKLEFLVDEISYALEKEDEKDWSIIGAHLSWTKDKVREILESGDWDSRIEWWDYCEIDSDGATPYSTEEQIAHLTALVKTKAVKGTDTQ